MQSATFLIGQQFKHPGDAELPEFASEPLSHQRVLDTSTHECWTYFGRSMQILISPFLAIRPLYSRFFAGKSPRELLR